MKIYVASSWRNTRQPLVVDTLRADGHDVYDFRHPAPGNDGFSWSLVAPGWQQWTPREYVKALEHPIAVEGYRMDLRAMSESDAFVLVMPCGRSAHLELGWAIGNLKATAILLSNEAAEPELMYKLADLVAVELYQVQDFLGGAQ